MCQSYIYIYKYTSDLWEDTRTHATHRFDANAIMYTHGHIGVSALAKTTNICVIMLDAPREDSCDSCLASGNLRHQRLGLGRHASKARPVGMAGHGLCVRGGDGSVLASQRVQSGFLWDSQTHQLPRGKIYIYIYILIFEFPSTFLRRQTDVNAIKDYDAEVQEIETRAAALKNATASLTPLTDGTVLDGAPHPAPTTPRPDPRAQVGEVHGQCSRCQCRFQRDGDGAHYNNRFLPSSAQF